MVLKRNLPLRRQYVHRHGGPHSRGHTSVEPSSVELVEVDVMLTVVTIVDVRVVAEAVVEVFDVECVSVLEVAVSVDDEVCVCVLDVAVVETVEVTVCVLDVTVTCTVGASVGAGVDIGVVETLAMVGIGVGGKVVNCPERRLKPQ